MSANHSPIVIKVGGRFFDELLNLSAHKHPLLHAIKALQAKGEKVVLVHGGGDQVQAQLKALNMHSQKVNGLRVTPFEHMPIVAGVLSGYLNKTLVAHSLSLDINTVGITLSDGNSTQCQQLSKELGAVGSPSAHDARFIQSLLDANILPVIASIGTDNSGLLYNVNADHAATCIAQLLHAKLLLLSDVSGVLDANKKKLDTLGSEQTERLIADKVITDGMIVKVLAAQDSADLLNTPVTIGSWNDVDALLDEGVTFGTRILPSQQSDT